MVLLYSQSVCGAHWRQCLGFFSGQSITVVWCSTSCVVIEGLCRGVGKRGGNVKSGSVLLLWLWRCTCTVIQLEWLHGAAAAGNGTSSFLSWVRHVGCDLLWGHIRNQESCWDWWSPLHLTLVHATLFIFLSQWARQGWHQQQCLERKGLKAKQMLYQHLLITLTFLPVLLLSLNLYLLFLHLPNSSSVTRKTGVTTFLWS